MSLEVFTGPRCRFTIDSTVVALGTDATAEQEWMFEGVDVLNNIETLTHEPVGYRCSLRASQIMLVDQTIEALGLAPKKGQSPQDHLKSILSLPSLVAQIEDDVTGTIVARVFGVRLGSQSFSVNARRMVPQELSFLCTRIVGASEAV